MMQMIETRELIALDGDGGVVRGTYHKSYNDNSGVQSNGVDQHRVGVLILNSLSPTRAANGDSAVYFADSFAECGYPTIRLDLPGFGDSDGDTAAELLSFINLGGYAKIASAKISELVQRFGLSGVVIAGHCAGSVSAIYTAAASKECVGLILMGPYFHLPPAKGSIKARRRLKLSGWQSRLDELFSRTYHMRNRIRLLLRGSRPPENANVSLLRCWKQLASAGLPILILKGPDRAAPGTKPKLGEFDYLKHVLRVAGLKSQISVKVAEGANQSFSNRQGRAAVREHAAQWLNARFSLKGVTEARCDSRIPEPSYVRN